MYNDEEKRTETYKSLISVSLELYKTLLLINGGGIVSILAYIGTRPEKYQPGYMTIISAAFFIIGLISVVFAIIFSYLVQFYIHSEISLNNKDSKENQNKYFFMAKKCIIVSIISMIIGFISGMIGIF